MAIRRTLAEFSDDIASADIAADAIDGTKLADNAVDSEHYTDGSIDTAHIADNQITLAKMAGGTDGQIITYDASGDPVAVGPGTDGQVLTSTGAGSPPAYEALPASNNASALTTGTLATARMASKTILQTVVDFDGSGTARTTTSSSYVDIAGLSVAITSSVANSDFLISFISGMHNGSTNEHYLNIKRVISGGATTNEIEGALYGVAQSRHVWDTWSGFYLDSLSESVSTTITYTLRHKNINNSSVMTWKYGTGVAALMVQEIAP